MALRSLAGGSLFAEAIGVSSPLVLALHGWGRRGSDFTNSLVSIGALAVDLPGFGATPAPDQVLGARDYAELLVPVLDEFERPPLLVGHSFGGRVAVCLASARPDRVGPVLVTGAPLLRSRPSRKPPLAYRTARQLNKVGIIGNGLMEKVKRNRGSADYRAASGIMRDILVKVVNEEYVEELESLDRPLSLLWGANDTEVPVDVAHRSAAIVNDAGGSAQVEVVEGVGHLLPIQAPDSLLAAVKRLMS